MLNEYPPVKNFGEKMSKLVLVLNCGSSSIKFAILDAESGATSLSGIAEQLGNEAASLTIKYNGEKHHTGYCVD